MRARLLIACLASIACFSSAKAEDAPPSERDVFFEDAAPVGSGLIYNPGSLIGRDVRVLFMTGCFKWDGAFYCVPIAPSIQGRIIIRAPDLKSEDALRLMDRRQCFNAAMASRCRMDIAFNVRDAGTDMSGTTRLITTDLIWAVPRL